MLLEVITFYVATPIAFVWAAWYLINLAIVVCNRDGQAASQAVSVPVDDNPAEERLIHVTQGAISKSVPGNADRCMVATAIDMAGFRHMQVITTSAHYANGEYLCIPGDISTRIDQFDRRVRVEPFTFSVQARGNKIVGFGNVVELPEQQPIVGVRARKPILIPSTVKPASIKLQIEAASSDGIYWFAIENQQEVSR